MSQIRLKQSRVRSLSKLKGFDMEKVEIWVYVEGDEAKKVGLKETGDVVLPSALFGSISYKNAYGYEYADYSEPKETRRVSTVWMYPYGNKNASKCAVDIYRECYPIVEVPAYGIELILHSNRHGKQFVKVNMTERVREMFLKEAVNLMLEIYGCCCISDDGIDDSDRITKQKRCNWEILPPGVMPSKHLKNQLIRRNKETDCFNLYRIEQIEKYDFDKVVEGVNGFAGYFAYLFDSHCVFESALYGNATYIIPRENWEALSQKTKRELFDENKVECKIIHTSGWKNSIDKQFRLYGIKKK